MSKITTNRTQYEKMVECLSERPDIARGFAKGPKEDVVVFWDNVAQQLNSLGPPTKDVSSWKKVWLDYKSYIKRKLSANKLKARATGGGPNRMHTFNDIEEKVIELTGMHTSTSGINGAVPFGVQPASHSTSPSSEEPALDVSVPALPERPIIQRRSNLLAKPDTAALVKEQITLQKEYYEKSLHFLEQQAQSSREMSNNIRRLYQVHENIHDMKRESLREKKRHNNEMEAMKRKELALQEKLLLLQEKNLQQ